MKVAYAMAVVSFIVLMLSLWLWVTQPHGVDQDPEVNSRIRYPNEEAVATKACGHHKLLAWWIENPRLKSATLHARCAGVITVEAEVAF